MSRHHEAAPAPADHFTRTQDALFLAGVLALNALLLALVAVCVRDPFACLSTFF